MLSKSNIPVSLFLVFLLACNTNQSKHFSKPTATKFSIIDTFESHTKADCILNYPGRKVYVGKISGKEIGFENINDTITFFYEKFNDLWVKKDSIHFGIQFIDTSDLNGDNFKDIIAIYNITGAGGNSENICLLYMPKERMFQHNKFFDLPNIYYDSNKHIIRSAWWGGVTSAQTKELYEFSGDSLRLKEGITYVPDVAAENGKEHLETYKILNGKKMIVKNQFGSSGNLWNKFYTMLWKGTEY
jgi:hypothetical protein